VADPLRITSVSTPHWGRASGRDVGVSDGLVVFYGPNEVGKSSFATAIAVLLTGQAFAEDLPPFGDPGDLLNARLTAKIGAGDLNVEVTTKVSGSKGRSEVKVGVTADLDGIALTLPDLSVRLGSITRDNYRKYYWVSAEEIFLLNSDEDEEHGRLSSRAIFGNLDPFKNAKDLEKEGLDRTGRRNGRAIEGSARFHAEKLPGLESQVRVAESGRGSWQGADSGLRQAIGEQETASEALKACNDKIGQLKRAIENFNLHLALETAQDDLRSTIEPTDVDRDLYANRESIDKGIGDLKGARDKLANAEAERRLATEQAGDWADLPARVDTKAAIDGVQTAEGDMRFHRGEYTNAEALSERADAERRIPTEDRPRSDRFTSPATALGLVVAALVLAVFGQGIPAAILGVAGAALLWRLRDGQSAKSGPDPRKEAGGDLAEAKARLKIATRDRDNILLVAGIPAESIPADNDHLAARLTDLGDLQRSRGDYDRCQTDVTTREAALLAYFPEGTEASETSTLLASAIASVKAHETAEEAVADAQRALHEALGGRETPEEEILKDNDRASLQTLLEAASNGQPDLDAYVVVAKEVVATAHVALGAAEAEADLQTPLLELEAVNDAVREQAVNGLARRLAADLLESSATAYLGDNEPELLRVANRIATEISDSWTGIRLDPHSDQFRVESTNGEYSEDRLSTGGRSLLNLALRLGAITVESEGLRVRLPVILDDALANLDADRRRTAFEVLAEFAEEHQVLYFTCHKHHADAAAEAGASVINF
jgi:uncharacterized protein YhaN